MTLKTAKNDERRYYFRTTLTLEVLLMKYYRSYGDSSLLSAIAITKFQGEFHQRRHSMHWGGKNL